MFSKKDQDKLSQKGNKTSDKKSQLKLPTSHKKQALIVIAVVLLLAGIAAGTYVLVVREDTKQAENGANISPEEEADALIAEYNATAKATQNQPTTVDPQQRLAAIQSQLAAQIQKENGNELASGNLELYISAATLANSLGDKAIAKGYAQKALLIFDKQEQASRDIYASVIKDLKEIAK